MLDPFLLLHRDVNNAIMEMLIMTYACKTSSANSIVGVIPYLPYSKQSQMRKRGSIVAKLLATMLCKAGTVSARMSLCFGKSWDERSCP